MATDMVHRDQGLSHGQGGRRRTAREGKPQRARERQTAAPAHAKPKTAGEGKRDPAQRGSGKPQPPQETKKGGERGKTRPAERGKTAAAREEAAALAVVPNFGGLARLAWPGRVPVPIVFAVLHSPHGFIAFYFGREKGAEDLPPLQRFVTIEYVYTPQLAP